MDTPSKQKKLNEIAQQVNKCTACKLHQQANRGVSGEGNPDAKVLFVGEGPGFNEDQRGIPFCGAAGRLLDELLASIKVARQDVWIGNVVKHRPPNNRDPEPEEIKACSEFLDEQIKTIDPKIIVTLGRFSMRKFLPEEYISRCHGQARKVKFANRDRIVIPMYHPAAGLRNGNIKTQLFKDFKKILMFMGNQPKMAEPETQEEENEEQLTLI
jgi:DNA polymerase